MNLENKTAFWEDLAVILEVEPAELHEGLVLDGSNWNSLAIVSAIVSIDEQFGITVEGDRLRDCGNLGQLLQVVQAAVQDRTR